MLEHTLSESESEDDDVLVQDTVVADEENMDTQMNYEDALDEAIEPLDKPRTTKAKAAPARTKKDKVTRIREAISKGKTVRGASRNAAKTIGTQIQRTHHAQMEFKRTQNMMRSLGTVANSVDSVLRQIRSKSQEPHTVLEKTLAEVVCTEMAKATKVIGKCIELTQSTLDFNTNMYDFIQGLTDKITDYEGMFLRLNCEISNGAARQRVLERIVARKQYDESVQVSEYTNPPPYDSLLGSDAPIRTHSRPLVPNAFVGIPTVTKRKGK